MLINVFIMNHLKVGDMSVVSKKPLIKQQTVYDREEKADSKRSFMAKRVSFDSTVVQSDSDEENSFGRSNRKPVKMPNGDDNDLLNMFRSELSDSEDDILQSQFKIKSKDKPNPVPRHLKSATRSVNQPADALNQTINPKAKPRQPRKISGDIQSKEGSLRSLKPKVIPREWQSKSTNDHEKHIYGMRRKTKPRHDLSDSEDNIAVDSRTKNNKLSEVRKNLETKLKKENSEENEYIDEDVVHSASFLRTQNERSHSQQELDKGQGEWKQVKSFEGKTVDKKDIDFEKKHRGMVPAPKPRKYIQDGIHDDISLGHYNTEIIDKDVPVPKVRKEQLVEIQEKEMVSKSILSKSRLHHLDVDNDSDEETHKKVVDKAGQMAKRDKNGFLEDEIDARSKKEKTLDWSSLDESDDEAVGQKQRSSTAKAMDDHNIDDNDNKEKGKVPKPSPRPKPRRELGNVQQQWQNDTLKNTIKQKDFTSSDGDYDSFQRIPRERVDRDRHTKRIVMPQRPGSSKARSSTGWGRDTEKDVITDMFEEHIPDTDDLIGGDHNQFQHRKDQLKPQSFMKSKKGPMKADQGIETMTRSPHLKQTLRHTDNQDWGYPSHGKQKSSSLTNLYRIEHSDDRDYDEDDGPRRNSLDTETIRQTVYDNWLSQKNVTIKKELSKKALEKQKEQEKRKEEEERKRSAKLAFQSWNQHKTETLKEQHSKIKAKQKEEQEKVQLERRMKDKDSKKYFESWKSKKDELIKETHREKKKEEKMKKKKEEDEKLEKTMSSKKSFENWKSKKDTMLKKQLKEKKKKEKVEAAKEEEESYEKTIKNADEFQKWAEKKGKPRKRPAPPALTQQAWVPGSRYISDSCIPPTVQPVLLHASSNRARTMSGTYRAKTKYYDI